MDLEQWSTFALVDLGALVDGTVESIAAFVNFGASSTIFFRFSVHHANL